MADFAHRDKVQLRARVLNDHAVEVCFSLIDVHSGWYQIVPERQVVAVDFDGAPSSTVPGKTRLNLVLDETYIRHTIATTTRWDFEGKGGQSTMDLFLPAKMLRSNHPLINYGATLRRDWIVFHFWVKDPDHYYLSDRDQERRFANHLIDDETSGVLVDLFAHWHGTTLNLQAAQLSLAELKAAVHRFVLAQMPPRFHLDQDYIIVLPDDADLQPLTIMSRVADAQAPVAYVRLQRAPTAPAHYYGSASIKLYNTGQALNSAIQDLANLTLKALEYHLDSPLLLRQALTADLNQQLAKYDLNLETNVYIVDLPTVLQALFLKPGARTVNLILRGHYAYLQNEAQVRITNTTTQIWPFNLNQVHLPPLILQLTQPAALQSAIQAHLNTHLYDRFGLTTAEVKVFYPIDATHQLGPTALAFLRQLVAANPPA